MRNLILFSALAALALTGSACGSSEQRGSSAGSPEAMPTATVRTPSQSSQTTNAPATSIAHGAPSNTGAPALGAQSGTTDTAALDQKVEQAENKAKASGASAADKQAAAAAYLERANVFYNAGNPSLYKFALRDFRRTLRYDPDNAEARAKRDQIVDIYTNSLHRPVPELGNEP
jgi:hypothetical protein